MANNDGDLFGSTCLFDSFESKGESCCPPSVAQKNGREAESDDDIKEVSCVNIQTVDLNTDDGFVVLDETGSEGGENEVVIEGDASRKTKGVADSDSVEIIEELITDCVANNEQRPNDKRKMVEDKASQSTFGKSEAAEVVLDSGFCNCEDCPYLREVAKFKRDNELLIEQVHQLTSQLRVTSRKFADVEITFLNQLAEMRYRQQVEEFLGKLLEENCPISEDVIQEDFTHFCIDKGTGSQESSSDKDEWKLPSYSQEYSISCESAESEKAASIKMPKNSCFNCLGNHMLTECPTPKDWSKISQNREEFLTRSGNTKQPRYHADEDLRFSTFKPGVISKKLRHALDYRSDEIPFFIYKMRELGYPPGWLKEAEITNSGITMYDSDRKEIGNNAEEGEVLEKCNIEVKYDPNRIIEYPGFNVPPHKGMRDNWRRYGFWPMQQHHQKSYVTMSMKSHDSTPVKRQAASQSSPRNKRQKIDPNDSNTEVTDMEIENDALSVRTNVEISSPSSSSLRHHKHGDPISHSDDGHESERDAYSLECSNSRKSSSRKQSSQCQTPAEESSSSEQTTRANSPSLEDLEQVKKNLILQLKDDSDVTPSLSDGSSREVPHAGILSNDNGDDLKSSKNVGNVSVTETNKVGKSKSMHLGSPAIIQLSKGMCMPSPEKFAVGVSEHIPFENLPDSAGQYKRMKGVIQKIREKNKAKF